MRTSCNRKLQGVVHTRTMLGNFPEQDDAHQPEQHHSGETKCTRAAKSGKEAKCEAAAAAKSSMYPMTDCKHDVTEVAQPLKGGQQQQQQQQQS